MYQLKISNDDFCHHRLYCGIFNIQHWLDVRLALEDTNYLPLSMICIEVYLAVGLVNSPCKSHLIKCSLHLFMAVEYNLNLQWQLLPPLRFLTPV